MFQSLSEQPSSQYASLSAGTFSSGAINTQSDDFHTLQSNELRFQPFNCFMRVLSLYHASAGWSAGRSRRSWGFRYPSDVELKDKEAVVASRSRPSGGLTNKGLRAVVLWQ